MSGICGVLRLDGSPARQAELGPVITRLERRGPDGSRIESDGICALGQTLLATTPEAERERMPLRDCATGCTITADIRLDNRGELAERLGADPMAGDGGLVLRAYLAWGPPCLDHLRGDFAFAIWDPREQRLFCARDQVGMRQLIHHHTQGRLFAFATEPLALTQHEDIPRDLDEGRLADYIEDLEGHDLTSTFFRGLFRLPPAHALMVDPRGMQIWRYWHFIPSPPLRLASEEAYAEAFREVFSRAVAARLRGPDPVASMLSGGMDSGSVAAIAARLLKAEGRPALATYSATSAAPDCIETATIRASMGMDHIAPHEVSLGALDEYSADLARLSRESEEPFDGHMTLLRAVYLAAHRAGHKVMLDGVGGDTTLAGEGMIAHHLRSGRLYRAWREARGEERFWGPGLPARTRLSRAAKRAFLPRSMRDLRERSREATRNREAMEDEILSPEFAARIDMPRRRREHRAHVSGFGQADSADPARSMLHPHVIVGRERYDRVASALAIEPRDPFLDLELLRFCAALPPEQLQCDGWPKIILRRAMAGLLPEETRWRVGKEHLGGDFTQALEARSLPIDEALVRETMRCYVSEDRMIDAKKGLADNELEVMQTLSYGARWLLHAGVPHAS